MKIFKQLFTSFINQQRTAIRKLAEQSAAGGRQSWRNIISEEKYQNPDNDQQNLDYDYDSQTKDQYQPNVSDDEGHQYHDNQQVIYNKSTGEWEPLELDIDEDGQYIDGRPVMWDPRQKTYVQLKQDPEGNLFFKGSQVEWDFDAQNYIKINGEAAGSDQQNGDDDNYDDAGDNDLNDSQDWSVFDNASDNSFANLVRDQQADAKQAERLQRFQQPQQIQQPSQQAEQNLGSQDQLNLKDIASSAIQKQEQWLETHSEGKISSLADASSRDISTLQFDISLQLKLLSQFLGLGERMKAMTAQERKSIKENAQNLLLTNIYSTLLPLIAKSMYRRYSEAFDKKQISWEDLLSRMYLLIMKGPQISPLVNGIRDYYAPKIYKADTADYMYGEDPWIFHEFDISKGVPLYGFISITCKRYAQNWANRKRSVDQYGQITRHGQRITDPGAVSLNSTVKGDGDDKDRTLEDLVADKTADASAGSSIQNKQATEYSLKFILNAICDSDINSNPNVLPWGQAKAFMQVYCQTKTINQILENYTVYAVITDDTGTSVKMPVRPWEFRSDNLEKIKRLVADYQQQYPMFLMYKAFVNDEYQTLPAPLKPIYDQFEPMMKKQEKNGQIKDIYNRYMANAKKLKAKLGDLEQLANLENIGGNLTCTALYPRQKIDLFEITADMVYMKDRLDSDPQKYQLNANAKTLEVQRSQQAVMALNRKEIRAQGISQQARNGRLNLIRYMKQHSVEAVNLMTGETMSEEDAAAFIDQHIPGSVNKKLMQTFYKPEEVYPKLTKRIQEKEKELQAESDPKKREVLQQELNESKASLAEQFKDYIESQTEKAKAKVSAARAHAPTVSRSRKPVDQLAYRRHLIKRRELARRVRLSSRRFRQW